MSLLDKNNGLTLIPWEGDNDNNGINEEAKSVSFATIWEQQIGKIGRMKKAEDKIKLIKQIELQLNKYLAQLQKLKTKILKDLT
jgi:hypothetical protein